MLAFFRVPGGSGPVFTIPLGGRPPVGGPPMKASP
jgi:hypothetical protein